ncbi:hypothetical protein [Ferruginibacter sp.]|nr:hypothetical protein [Ferruginibacter sp.]
MQENQLDNINHQSVDNKLMDARQVEISLINKILLDKGELFVEQKFYNIVQTISSITKANVSPTQLYSQIFPNLTPTRKGIEKVLENAINSKEFKPLYHSSEYLYQQWLINFNNCVLINSVDTIIKINAQSCKKTLEEFKLWVLDFPTLKGSFIRSNIKWDSGILPFGIPTKYIPKNSTVKKDILEQLAKNGTMQLVSMDDIKNKIEISLENSDIILTRKSRYPIAPKILQSWLKNFGITISLVTSTYLIEFGMPYGGNNISLDEILRYTNNGYGIIGLLAFQLAFLINMDDSNNTIEFRHHPLSQSIVLGLARLEYFLNPKIACL